MLLEALRRAETAVKEAVAVASAGGVSCGELRDALVVTKTVAGVVAAAQTQLASAIAKAERHGDGGTGVLAETTGLTRREARGQVKTAKAIAEVPSVRDAVAQGRVSLANAKRLADAVERTSAGAVGADGELLKMAESMHADQFTKQARRWIAEQQDDGGEADYQRMRAKRSVRVWDNDSGMVELHATFDPLTGRRIGNRLRAEADRLFQNDKKRAAERSTHREHERGNGRPGSPGEQRDNRIDNGAPGDVPNSNKRGNGLSRTGEDGEARDAGDVPNSNKRGNGRQGQSPGNSRPNPGRRTFEQCMADALDNLTSNTTSSITATPTASKGRRSTAGTGTGAIIGNGQTACTGIGHVADQDSGATVSNGQAIHASGGDTAGQDTGAIIGNGQAVHAGMQRVVGADTEATNSNGRRARTDTCTCTGRGGGADVSAGSGVGADGSAGTGLGKAFADVCVIVQVDAATGEVVAQLPDGQRLPASVLDKLTCNARISVILSNSRGRPLWGAVASRTATDMQRRLLLARWGGCFHCAAHPAMCEIHHMVPVSRGGETKIDNMIPVCWECHHLIHDNHWQIHRRSDGNHTLHPPDRHHHGPAHAPEQPLLFTQN